MRTLRVAAWLCLCSLLAGATQCQLPAVTKASADAESLTTADAAPLTISEASPLVATVPFSGTSGPATLAGLPAPEPDADGIYVAHAVPEAPAPWAAPRARLRPGSALPMGGEAPVTTSDGPAAGADADEDSDASEEYEDEGEAGADDNAAHAASADGLAAAGVVRRHEKSTHTLAVPNTFAGPAKISTHAGAVPRDAPRSAAGASALAAAVGPDSGEVGIVDGEGYGAVVYSPALGGASGANALPAAVGPGSRKVAVVDGQGYGVVVDLSALGSASGADALPAAVGPDSGQVAVVDGEGYGAVVDLSALAPSGAPLFTNFQAKRLKTNQKGKKKGKGKKKTRTGAAASEAAKAGASSAQNHPRAAGAAMGIQALTTSQLQKRVRQHHWAPVAAVHSAAHGEPAAALPTAGLYKNLRGQSLPWLPPEVGVENGH